MPTFDTPQPVSATLTVASGDIRVFASERTDTVVTVAPANASDDRDVRDAEQTEVEYESGRLVVRGPRQSGFAIFGRSGTVDVTVELPAGSAVDATLGAGAVRCTGTLGDTRLKSGAGDLWVENAATLRLNTGLGTVSAEHVAGDADVTTASGRLNLRSVGGRAVLKNGNGDTWVGAARGDLRVNTANGNVVAGHTSAPVTVSTANGDIRLGEVVHGEATLKSAAGRIEVGIRRGTAARLDLHTGYGRVVNELDATGGPAESDDRAEVRARTGFGDIVIRRAPEEAS